MTKFMRPIDCAKYTNVNPQRIREIMKRGLFDLGYVVNLSGRRYQYFIQPAKFFAWIGAEVPVEWR